MFFTSSATSTKPTNETPKSDHSVIPKVKLKLGEHTIAICTDGETITRTFTNSCDQPTENLIEHCGIEIEKKKNKSYVLFPSVDAAESAFPTNTSAVTATKLQHTSLGKNDAAPNIVERSIINNKIVLEKKEEDLLSNVNDNVTKETEIAQATSNATLKCTDVVSKGTEHAFEGNDIESKETNITPKKKAYTISKETDVLSVLPNKSDVQNSTSTVPKETEISPKITKANSTKTTASKKTSQTNSNFKVKFSFESPKIKSSNIERSLSNETSKLSETLSKIDSKSPTHKSSTETGLTAERDFTAGQKTGKVHSDKGYDQKPSIDMVESHKLSKALENVPSTGKEISLVEKQIDEKNSSTHVAFKHSEKVSSRRISERMEIKRKEKENSTKVDGEDTKIRGQQRGKASFISEKLSSTEMSLEPLNKEKPQKLFLEQQLSSASEQPDSRRERKRTLSATKNLEASSHEGKRNLSSDKEPETSCGRKRKLSSREVKVKHKVTQNKSQKLLHKKSEPASKTAKSDAKNFEQKYEMFKQKWKAEKERRRQLKAVEPGIHLSSYVSDEKTNKYSSSKIDKVPTEKIDDKSITEKIEEKPSTEIKLTTPVQCLSQVKNRPKVKHTPSTRFGKSKPIRTKSSMTDSKTSEISVNNLPETEVETSESISTEVTATLTTMCSSVVISTSTLTTSTLATSTLTTSTLATTTTTTTMRLPNSSTLSPIDVAPVKKKGWPKGRPRKRKVDNSIDTSRTPNMLETISFASMVEEERPSQKSRPISLNEIPAQKVTREPSTFKSKEDNSFSHVFKPETNVLSSAKVTPSLTQIVASRIQKRVHQQKSQSTVSMFNSSPVKKYYEDAANKESIVFHDIAGETHSPLERFEQHKKKNLNFITGRLQYKMKIDALKLKNAATLAQNVEISHFQNQEQRSSTQVTSNALMLGPHQGVNPHRNVCPMLLSPPHTISNNQLLFTTVQPHTRLSFSSYLHPNLNVHPPISNSAPAFDQIANPRQEICTMKPTCICLNCHQKRILSIRSPPSVAMIPNMSTPPPQTPLILHSHPVVASVASSINEKLRQKIVGGANQHANEQSKQARGLELMLKSPLTSSGKCDHT